MAHKMTKTEAIAFGKKIHEEAVLATANLRDFETQMMARQGFSLQEIENFFAVRAVERNIALGLGKSRRVLRMQYSC